MRRLKNKSFLFTSVVLWILYTGCSDTEKPNTPDVSSHESYYEHARIGEEGNPPTAEVSRKTLSFKGRLASAAIRDDLFTFEKASFIDIPDDVYEAAREGLVEIGVSFRPDLIELMGIDENTIPDDIHLGTPYELIRIPLSSLRGEENAEERTLVSMGSWMFPVIINDHYKIMMRISHHQGRWQMVTLGGAGLAKWAERVEKQYNYDDDVMRARVISYQLGLDFLAFAPERTGLTNGQFFPGIREDTPPNHPQKIVDHPVIYNKVMTQLKQEARVRILKTQPFQ